MNEKQVTELILQSLEHEKGGVMVYETALQCVINEDLRGEWEKYLDETNNHVRILTDVCNELGLDPEMPTPGREIVKKVGLSLVAAMKEARTEGPPEAAQLVACEAVVLAETKDHLDWELLGKCGEKLGGAKGKALQKAAGEVEDQEDEHLYHSRGWCRELWIESLGMKAILPPMEEQKDVKTAIGAAKAQQAADKRR
jgi:rubrerythrin